MTRLTISILLLTMIAAGCNKSPKVAVLAETNKEASAAFAQDPKESPPPAKKAASPEALQAEIDALRAPKVAWREIAWKSCLLEGLKESRAKNKPALLWVFIDRPIDDARC